MQKFRDYIYCDVSRMTSYISQIPELSKVETTSTCEQTTDVDSGLDIKIVKAGTTLSEKSSTNYTLNSSPMERFVNWSCDEENAINYDGEKLQFDDKDKLIVLNGKMSMPEMSENMEMINTIAKNTALFNMIPMSDDDREKIAFIKESDNIPILLELDSDYIFNGNLKKDCIIGNKDDFLDNTDDEITIIGRIDKVYNIEEDIEIYDLVKEVFNLNRAIRRKMPKESLKDAIIYEKGPIVKITPIIIYK
ncbi:MAG TPA: hypothetical protein IAC85_06775 [Candidatus Faecenecus gallistercoris]|uniref:Uncharacterized protein n=1 Tax=Candidatus Faecenecus gallistercoris TaxID=2840793 RepID=A0A9D0Z0R0_9FIRM|nr:hypothetical protein [Candidatus Faecenecus gallistercoris]